jgi:hypothetical protein
MKKKTYIIKKLKEELKYLENQDLLKNILTVI